MTGTNGLQVLLDPQGMIQRVGRAQDDVPGQVMEITCMRSLLVFSLVDSFVNVMTKHQPSSFAMTFLTSLGHLTNFYVDPLLFLQG